MARFDKSEEPDYLVEAQPQKDPHSFPNVVREAYALEYGFTKDEQIGDLLGRDKSLVSQVFRKDPKKLTVHSIEQLIAPLSTGRQRKKVVAAWTRVCFETSPTDAAEKDYVGKTVSDKTLKRIDRQIREHRLQQAVATAYEAAGKTADYALRQQFWDRAYFASQRLDRPHLMMEMAAHIARDAKKAGEVRRLIAAHADRARALLMLSDCRPEEVEPVFSLIQTMLQGAPAIPDPHPPYVLTAERTLDSLRISALITFSERGICPLDEDRLQAALDHILSRLKQKSGQEARFRDHISAARLYILLNKGFQAQEHLEKAFRSGDVKNVHVFPICSLQQGRAMRLTESAEAAYLYLWRAGMTAERGFDPHHQRLAHYEVARLANELFPE